MAINDAEGFLDPKSANPGMRAWDNFPTPTHAEYNARLVAQLDALDAADDARWAADRAARGGSNFYSAKSTPNSRMMAQVAQQVSDDVARTSNAATMAAQVGEPRALPPGNWQYHPSNWGPKVGQGWNLADPAIPGTPAVQTIPGGTSPIAPVKEPLALPRAGQTANAASTLDVTGYKPPSQGAIPGVGNLPSAAAQNAVDDVLRVSTGVLDDAAAATGAKINAIDDVAVKATGAADESLSAVAKGAAEKGAGGRGAGILMGLNTNINKLVPGLGVNITTGSLMTGLTVAGLGLMAGGFVDRFNLGGEGSNWDVGISGAIKGAGLGAGVAIALGLSTGPIGWAALGGAAIFAVANIFGDHKSAEDKANDMIDKSRQTIASLISTPAYGIDSFTAQQINQQFEMAVGLYSANKDWAGLEGYLRGLASTVPQFLLEASERNRITQQRMALQASFGPVYANMMTRSADVAKTAFDTQMQAAAQITDPNISAAFKSQAAQNFQASQDLRAAYSQQVAMGTTALPGGAQAVQDQAQQMISQMMSPVP